MFKKFAEYLAGKEGLEENTKAGEYDAKLAKFNARFPDGSGADIVKAAGYPSVRDFLQDSNPDKWAKLRIPGQENYTR